MPAQTFEISGGLPYPLGVTMRDGGINIAVASIHAQSIFIALFEGDVENHCLALPDRTGPVFHGFIAGVGEGQRYGLRASGAHDPARGKMFDVRKLLVDPYATVIDRAFTWHEELGQPGRDTALLVPRGIVTAALAKLPVKTARQPGVIYEVPVRAFSLLHPDVPEAMRGTVAALAQPAVIAHFKSLGVDTIELMPLMAWIDERHLARMGLANSWGYNPASFMAPDPRLAPGGMAEIRATVATLQAAGFQVILDVVFNHSGESDLGGPTLSLRGLDNEAYYALQNGALINDTGCGNTLALQQPLALRLAMDALRHWVEAGGFDGFRYDLAPVMGRDAAGFSAQAALLQAINQDPVLRGLIHIAEPWDIGPGGYQLGHFPAGWGEWNDRYRDDVRHFWRGDQWAQGQLATRLAGSADIFDREHRRPSASINFVAAHDGFTLEDVVQFSAKNNIANGENNRDGNGSEPCWVSADPERDVRALLATLFLSRGTPMLTAGDEFGRSQNGNNNAYAQDNELTWLNWVSADHDRKDFTARLIAFRRQHAAYFADRFLTGQPVQRDGMPDVAWFGANGQALDAAGWQSAALAIIGMALSAADQEARLLILFNRGTNTAQVDLPTAGDGFGWHFADELFAKGQALSSNGLLMAQRCVVALVERPDAKARITRADDALIGQLATAAGIQGEWWEVNGTHHKVSAESQRHLLDALGLPTGTANAVRRALTKLDRERVSPDFHLVEAHRSGAIPLQQRSSSAKQNFSLVLAGETFSAITIEPDLGGNFLKLPPLPPGLHRLVDDHGETLRHVLAHPAKCHLPDDLQQGGRAFGVGSHLYALRHASDWGIGDFETLARLGERTARQGGTFVGINPLHHMFVGDRARVSPYQPSDRRFIDPIYIDVEALAPGAADSSLLEALRAKANVDYKSVWQLKEKVLHKLFKAKLRAAEQDSLQEFINAGGAALAAHGQFEGKGKKDAAEFAIWLQWIADRQLGAAALRTDMAGLRHGIYRDLALGCAYEGGELASDPDLFCASVSIGSPPDPFSADGQVWNLPPHNPLTLRARHYEPYREILRANMRHAGMLRIDHVLGLARQFWVPRGGSGADGAYVTMPLDILTAVTALESERHACIVVGEDLGTVPDGLRAKMDAMNILSYRMLWFEREGNSFKPPRHYPRQALSCLSSHDLLPFRGWQATATPAELSAMEQVVASGPDDLMVKAHGALAAAPTMLMQIQADDLTAETTPLNVPGTDQEQPNWQRRLSQSVDTLFDSPLASAIINTVKQNQSETP